MSSRARHSFASLCVVCFILFAAGRALAAAPPRRIAIVVGSNLGLPHEPTLRFAQRDAGRVAQTLRELGGVASRDLFLLLDSDVGTVRRSFDEVARRAKSEDRPTVLVFYYSGHADATALHLGAGKLPWDELRGLIENSGAQLRVALIDACQSGAMTTEKGITLGPQIVAQPIESRGTAILASASSTETSQEALSLGGSFFTHFLVSGLRGAADADDDGKVTLNEAYAYTSKNTQQATGAWARAVQHPSYQFDISGQGDVVLAELQEASAQLALDAALDGHVLVSEGDSPFVVVESEKRAGQPLRLALPSGRYRVHLRRTNAIYLAEVSLPWGGRAQLTEKNFSRRSYQEVAQKGARLEIHRHRLRAGVAYATPVLGLGPYNFSARLGYGYKLGRVELGARFSASENKIKAVDTTIPTTLLGGAIVIGADIPIRRIDARLWGLADFQYWRQRVPETGVRNAFVPGLGLGVGARVPIRGAFFCEPSLEAIFYLPRVAGKGVDVAPTLIVDLAFGVLL